MRRTTSPPPSRRSLALTVALLLPLLQATAAPAYQYVQAQRSTSATAPATAAGGFARGPGGTGTFDISGTNPALFLQGGSAQLDLAPSGGRVFLPTGAQYRERPAKGGGFGPWKRILPSNEGGSWLPGDLRRFACLDTRCPGTAEAPVRVEGVAKLSVRGYNAAVQWRVDEQGPAFALYRFPVRDPKKEAEEQRRWARELELSRKSPWVREREEYRAQDGVRGDLKRDDGGVFNGF